MRSKAPAYSLPNLYSEEEEIQTVTLFASHPLALIAQIGSRLFSIAQCKVNHENI